MTEQTSTTQDTQLTPQEAQQAEADQRVAFYLNRANAHENAARVYGDLKEKELMMQVFQLQTDDLKAAAEIAATAPSLPRVYDNQLKGLFEMFSGIASDGQLLMGQAMDAAAKAAQDHGTPDLGEITDQDIAVLNDLIEYNDDSAVIFALVKRASEMKRRQETAAQQPAQEVPR